jgi:hypothetical protein
VRRTEEVFKSCIQGEEKVFLEKVTNQVEPRLC